MSATRPEHERFWEKVKRGPGCWEWQGHRRPRGYGLFARSRQGGRKQIIWDAHRFAWMIERGPIPLGMLVCHHCDNPACVRPDHLFLGTNRDNKLDSVSKGRHRWCNGEKNGRAKLTASDVAMIRRRLTAGEKQADIADAFGVSQTTVSLLHRRKTWRGTRLEQP